MTTIIIRVTDHKGNSTTRNAWHNFEHTRKVRLVKSHSLTSLHDNDDKDNYGETHYYNKTFVRPVMSSVIHSTITDKDLTWCQWCPCLESFSSFLRSFYQLSLLKGAKQGNTNNTHYQDNLDNHSRHPFLFSSFDSETNIISQDEEKLKIHRIKTVKSLKNSNFKGEWIEFDMNTWPSFTMWSLEKESCLPDSCKWLTGINNTLTQQLRQREALLLVSWVWLDTLFEAWLSSFLCPLRGVVTH